MEGDEEPVELADQSAQESSEHILTGLPDVEDSVFSSSGARIMLPSDRRQHPMVFWLCALLLVTAMLGFINGLDYIDGDSGLINHRRFINMDTKGAAPGSAILLGTVVYEDGSAAPNHTVQVTVKRDDGTIIEKGNTTDENGNYRIEGLDPGVQVLMIANASRGTAQLVQHLVLLNPPPKMTFEPIGFTTIRLTFPSDATFEQESEDGSFINYVPYEAANEKELYDSSAAGLYVMIGVGFSGIALIGIIATVLGYRDGGRGMLRMAAVLVFFSQGPYGSACCLGALAFGLTFALPKVHHD